ncbi:MAG: S-layer homology domain-containing protein [Lysinibacillus sp.]
MDKKKIQKVNKALIATVFATSGVTVAMPIVDHASAAGKYFSDVKLGSTHYDNILKLSARGIISGYNDGTFRPANGVTRAQAAKMLAKTLGIDEQAVKDPGYKDVPRNHPYYTYIAALENAGIMTGYNGPEKKFMPNEKITRGQMSKILVLGFKFEVATKFDHKFKDVTPQTSHAAYIQTLVNLEITTGKTAVTYEPFLPVTRGQMASFLIRSEEKRDTTTSYKITSVDSNYVYINSVPYKVDSSLKHVLNQKNATVLKGATIEGKLSNNTIHAVSKLTLNESGSKSKMLELNGNYGVFTGDIVVNSNYIRFKNIDVTGTVLLNETVRQGLRDSANIPNRMSMESYVTSNKLLASSSNYIDWSAKSTLTSMKDVEKYVEFVNSIISKIIVAKNKAKIVSDTQILQMDIISDVREIELQADVKILNVNTETDLTIYGEGDVELLNKNSFKDLKLYFDGTVDKLVVGNVYGWIDLGDRTYVIGVILPKDETPNNVFDDYLEDHENIDYIEDPDGKPIDKDPIENQKPADKTKPIVAITKAESANGSTAIVEFTSNEVGTYYYIVKEKNETPPTLRELVDQRPGNGAARGSGATAATAASGATPAKPMKLMINNLGEKKEYVIYLIVVDGSKNISEPVAKKEFTMKDSTLPKVTGIRGEGLHGGQRMKITFTASEPGEYYYYIRKAISGTNIPAPTTAEIMSNPTGKGTAVTGKLGITELVTGLSANTNYEIYVAMKDTSGNISADPAANGIGATGDLDNINPFVTGPGWPSANDPLDKQLIPHPAERNKFYLYFNEELEKETAEDIQNYDLSGTGIINIGGQGVIKPAAVVYEKYGSKGSRVLITVPSLTGFVNGDTLKATVLPGVKDLAANDFENKTTVNEGTSPRNHGDYRHDDSIMPVLKITNVIKNNSSTAPKVEVTFEASKAGTYYYMVMPESTDLTALKIEPRDFVDEFTNAATKKFDKLGGGKIYLSKSGNNPATLGSQKFDITETSALNPFESYAVFMVLRDRSGQLSQIQRAQMIDDSIAPDITGLGVKSKVNADTNATITYNSNEKGTAYYWYVPKYTLVNGNRELNPEIHEVNGDYKKLSAAQIKTTGQTKEMIQGQNTIDITGLQRHEDYVLYFAVEDTFGNLTEKSVETATQRPVDPNKDGPAAPMIIDFFADGTKPRVEDPIFKQIDGKTFEVTFSEAVGDIDPNNKGGVMPSGVTFFDLTNLDGTTASPALPGYSWAWEADAATKNTWDPRKMIIRFDTEVNQSFALTVNAGITDIGGSVIKGHLFSEGKPKASHIFRTLTTGIESAQLKEPIELNGQGDRSPNIKVTFDFLFHDPSIQAGEIVNYYYKVYSKLNDNLNPNPVDSVTEEEIIIPDIDYAYWSLSSGNGNAPFKNGRIVAEITHPSVSFIEGDSIVIVLVDKYGNKYKVKGIISK